MRADMREDKRADIRADRGTYKMGAPSKKEDRLWKREGKADIKTEYKFHFNFTNYQDGA